MSKYKFYLAKINLAFIYFYFAKKYYPYTIKINKDIKLACDRNKEINKLDG